MLKALLVVLTTVAVAFIVACGGGEETGRAKPIGGDRYYSFVYEYEYDFEKGVGIDRCVAVYEWTGGRRREADLDKCVTDEQIKNVKEKYKDFIERIPGVIGIAHGGISSTIGERTNEVGIIVVLKGKERRELNELDVEDKIPPGLDGVAAFTLETNAKLYGSDT